MNTEEYVNLLLEQRGMTTEESRRRFLEFSENDLRRAADMEGGAALLARLEEAVKKQENVTVYGDYDADGVMASCIFYMGLVTLLPGKTACFINNRFDDGYNITAGSMAKLFELFPETKVVLTCDNGINAAEGADVCRSAGSAARPSWSPITTSSLRRCRRAFPPSTKKASSRKRRMRGEGSSERISAAPSWRGE